MLKRYFLAALFFCLCCQPYGLIGQDSLLRHVKLLFLGDIMGHMPQVHAAYDSSNDRYDYAPCFQFIKEPVLKCDLSIGNLEVVFGGKPYTGYPTFSSPDDLVFELRDFGIDVLATANNHCYDKGKSGMYRTLKMIDSVQLLRMGTYYNAEDRASKCPLIVEKNGIKIALFNYTYGTNGFVPDPPSVVNYLDRDQIKADVKVAEEKRAEVKIAFVHWGNEYELTPSDYQKKYARMLAQMGFDAVVGSHPHVVQTFEWVTVDSVNKMPVFYSTGNFISNQRDRYKDGGAVVTLNIEITSGKVDVKPMYIPYWVYKGTLSSRYQYYVIPIQYYQLHSDSLHLPPDAAARLKEHAEDLRIQLPNILIDTTYFH